MHNQRQRHQRKHLVETVHRHDILRQRNPKGHSVGNHIKHEEKLLMSFMLHIFKGVQGRQGPERRQNRRKYRPQAVQPETEAQVSRKTEQYHRFIRLIQQHREHQR